MTTIRQFSRIALAMLAMTGRVTLSILYVMLLALALPFGIVTFARILSILLRGQVMKYLFIFISVLAGVLAACGTVTRETVPQQPSLLPQQTAQSTEMMTLLVQVDNLPVAP